jgi:ribosomal protein S27AE
MHEGMVQLVSQACRTCGYDTVRPQTNNIYNKWEKETVVEATWICPRCGSHFASGIVERIPDEKNQ